MSEKKSAEEIELQRIIDTFDEGDRFVVDTKNQKYYRQDIVLKIISQSRTTLTLEEEQAMDGIEWPLTFDGTTIRDVQNRILISRVLHNLVTRLLNAEQERRKR